MLRLLAGPGAVLCMTACLLTGSQSVQAHRLKTLFTTVQYNPRSQMLEVIHRTYAHDVEHTLGNNLRSRGGLENIEARARTSLELARGFTLWNQAGEQIPLEVIGAELEAEYFYIYQEAPMDGMPDYFRVRHLMLRNYWPDMTNYLNVHFESGVDSLLFTGDTVTLPIAATSP